MIEPVPRATTLPSSSIIVMIAAASLPVGEVKMAIISAAACTNARQRRHAKPTAAEGGVKVLGVSGAVGAAAQLARGGVAMKNASAAKSGLVVLARKAIACVLVVSSP
ncbi:MAG: hypothetical protein AAF790_08865 [Planctomycetota bacterium]